MTQTGEKIHIALATDDNYLDFAMVVINSVAHFHPAGALPVVVHLLTSGLSAGARRRLASFQPRGVEIREIAVDAASFARRWCGARSPMFYRLELPELLESAERCIYLDCDMVALDDIEKLWRVELRGHPLGAVGDRAGFQAKRKRYAADGRMFNSGMMVMDLKLWRQRREVERLRQYWHDHNDEMQFADQGLLNVCFSADYCLLHQRWNIINSVYRNPPMEGVYSAAEVREALHDPGIVHFTGHHKPWMLLKRFHHPYGYTFCRMALKTPVSLRKRVTCWLKLHCNCGFVDSPKKGAWSREDIRDITI